MQPLKMTQHLKKHKTSVSFVFVFIRAIVSGSRFHVGSSYGSNHTMKSKRWRGGGEEDILSTIACKKPPGMLRFVVVSTARWLGIQRHVQFSQCCTFDGGDDQMHSQKLCCGGAGAYHVVNMIYDPRQLWSPKKWTKMPRLAKIQVVIVNRK